MLFREVIPTTGNIYVNGVDLLELKEKEIPYLRRQLGIIFQDYRLLPDRTVYDNVAFAMQVIETPYRKIKRRVMSVLDLVGCVNGPILIQRNIRWRTAACSDRTCDC